MAKERILTTHSEKGLREEYPAPTPDLTAWKEEAKCLM